MKKIIAIIFLVLISCLAGNSQSIFQSNVPSQSSDNNVYKYVSKLRLILHLKKLNNGYDSINIRIWYLVDLGYNEMYEIKKTKGVWAALHHRFFLTRNKNGELKVKKKEATVIQFKSKPDSLLQKLILLGIDTLHAEDQYKMEDVKIDGMIYCFEVGKRNSYSFFNSDNVYVQGKKYNQAAVALKIVKLMDYEFDIIKRRKEIWNPKKNR